MSLRRFLVLLAIATTVAWVSWILVLNFIDPGTGDPFSVFLFSGSLFLALAGTIAILGFLLRLRRTSAAEFVLYRALATSVRQGFLLSIALVLSLTLQGQRLLRWWNALALILALVLIETIAQRERRGRTHAG